MESSWAGETPIASGAMKDVIYTAGIWSEPGNGAVVMTLGTDSRSLDGHVHMEGLCNENRLVMELNALKKALGN